jgi:hypothetical protein
MKMVIGPAGQNVKRIGVLTGTFVNVSQATFATDDHCTDHIVSISPKWPMDDYSKIWI